MTARPVFSPTLALLCLALATPTLQACQPDAEQTLAALNQLRAQVRQCGNRTWSAASPLRWNPVLAESAMRYARELARRDRIDHVGEAASSLRLRLREVGYVMRTAGENLAGGPESLDETLATWAASPTHCENLMWPAYSEAGLACVTGPGKLQRYWVLHLAEPVQVGFVFPPLKLGASTLPEPPNASVADASAHACDGPPHPTGAAAAQGEAAASCFRSSPDQSP